MLLPFEKCTKTSRKVVYSKNYERIMFIKGLNYLNDWVVCLKNQYITDLSELSQLLRFDHALKEISKTIFRKTFRNFAVLHIAGKSRKVTILLR